MSRPIAMLENGKIIKVSRVWTFRHYRVCLVGWLCALVYAGGLRLAVKFLGWQEPPIWIVALVGVAAMWAGFVFARLAWFDRN